MKYRIVSVFMCILMVILPLQAKAGQQDPDDSLNVSGKLVYIGKGESTPWAGILFDIPAATKLKLDKQFMTLKFKLELDFMKKQLIAEHTLKLSSLQIKHDTLKSKTDSLLRIKGEEILRLQELVKKNPNDYTHWWFAGGIIAGILLSMGIYFAAAEANK